MLVFHQITPSTILGLPRLYTISHILREEIVIEVFLPPFKHYSGSLESLLLEGLLHIWFNLYILIVDVVDRLLLLIASDGLNSLKLAK